MGNVNDIGIRTLVVKQESKKRQRYQKASDLTGIASDGWGAAALIGHSPGQDPGRSVLALGVSQRHSSLRVVVHGSWMGTCS